MQAFFGVAKSVASLIFWREAHVSAVVRRAAVWLREQPAAPDTPGMFHFELWWHGYDRW